LNKQWVHCTPAAETPLANCWKTPALGNIARQLWEHYKMAAAIQQNGCSVQQKVKDGLKEHDKGGNWNGQK
jgi:hypothetical protein